MIHVIYKQQQQFYQNQVVPFQQQPQVSTIENLSGSGNLSRSVRIRNQAVQFNNWVQNSETMETAKRILSVNIPTASVLFFSIPPNVIFMYVYFSGAGTCENTGIINYYRVVLGLSIIPYLVYLAVAKIKLEKMSNPNNPH